MTVMVGCDSCGANVEVNNRAQVVLSMPGYAGTMLDLCATCAGEIAALPKVRAASKKQRKARRDQIVAQGGEPGPEMYDPDDPEEAAEMPTPTEAPKAK